MFTLPSRFAPLILAFASLFRQRTWVHAQQLLIGALLAPARRTVTSALRVLGLAQERHFGNYHRVLNRAVWSLRAASRQLLALLLQHVCPRGPIVLGLDDTLERRRGKRIRARGVYRDPVQSSPHRPVTAPGLRWLSLMLLAPIPWAQRVWALPFLTALTRSPRVDAAEGRRHKTLAVWGRQLLLQTHRWLRTLAPDRPVILVADAGFAVVELLTALAPRMTCITRLRWNACLYAPAPPRLPHTRGRPRKKGARLPSFDAILADPSTAWTTVTIAPWYGEAARVLQLASGTGGWTQPNAPVLPLRWVIIRDPDGHFDPQALLCTDPYQTPEAIVRYFVQRWQVEVTFAETRRHLGVETQRQWSEAAIARTTPILFGLFSLVTLCATQLPVSLQTSVRAAAWYPKVVPTFSDTLAVVRATCWATRAARTLRDSRTSRRGRRQRARDKIPRALTTHLVEAFCYAA
jgi:hypothetical protein